MDNAVQCAPSFPELGCHPVRLFLHCDVELVDLDCRRKFAGCTVCERKAPTEAGEGYLGSFLLGEARRTESERVISQHSGDQNALAFEYPHGSTVALVGD